MRITYNDELNKLTAPYLESLLKNKISLEPETAVLFDIFIEDMDTERQHSIFSEKLEPHLERIIREENIKSIANLTDGKLKKLFQYMLGDEYSRLFYTYLQLEARCPNTFGYYRRSQRSADPSIHLTNVRNAWVQFLSVRASGLPDQTILYGGNTQKETEACESLACSCWLSAQIAQDNKAIIEQLQNMLTGKDKVHRLHPWHLHAIAISGHSLLLEEEGKLLLKSKLKESVRQAIVETMDLGCPESYLCLFSVIYENGLECFASIKRSIAVCTGLGEYDCNEWINKEYLKRMWVYLNNPELAQKAIHSENTVELYLALWSIGFYDMKAIRLITPRIIKNGAKHEIKTLLYFLHSVHSSLINHHISKDVFDVWHDNPEVVAAILPLYMDNLYLRQYCDENETPQLNHYFEHKEEATRHFQYLKQIYESISDKEVYPSYVFPWDKVTLTRTDVVLKMAYIAWMTNESQLKDELCPYLSNLEAYTRANYIRIVLAQPDSAIQQEYVMQSLCDRSLDVREGAYKVLCGINLSPEQYRSIESMLRFKYSEMRINAIKLLMKQPKEKLAGCIRRLLCDKVADRRLAGLDMMKIIRQQESMQDIYDDLLESVKGIEKPSMKEKPLIESLTQVEIPQSQDLHYTKENGFGLYNPTLEVNLPEITHSQGFNFKKTFEFIRLGKAKVIFEKLDRYIDKHKDDQFVDIYGNTQLVGNRVLLNWYKQYEGLSELGLPELWRSFYEQEIGSYDKLLMMKFMLASTGSPEDTDEGYEYDPSEKEVEDQEAVKKSLSHFDAITNRMYAGVTYHGLKKPLRNLTYYDQIADIVDSLAVEYRNETYYQQLSVNMLLQLIPLLNEHNIFRKYTNKHIWLIDKQEYGEKEMIYPIHSYKPVLFWLDMPLQQIDDALFARYFNVRYQLYKLANYMEYTTEQEDNQTYLQSIDFARAWLLGLIPSEEVYRELMGRASSPHRLKEITTALINSNDNSLFQTLVQKVVNRILEIEVKRGDSETEVTRLAKELKCIHGADKLIGILQAFGKDSFVRDFYKCRNTKPGVLSSLLHACYPSPKDTGELLKELALRTEISNERLIEAAIFAPQWLELTERATGWKGLESTAYYFHAHTCEQFDDKKRAIIARYTPIDIEDLRAGAFDIDWFKDAYSTIGKERFEVVYNATKLISANSSLTRIRKFNDAASGNIKVADIKKDITNKRNKDSLMCYGIIPLGQRGEKELLERYKFILKFLKESKELTAQKLESEKKAINIALQNLAYTAGLGNVIRLAWSMETMMIKTITPYFTPKSIDGVEIYIFLNEDGSPEISQTKDGKVVSNLPPKLKKNAYVEGLKEVHNKLKELHTQSRIALEYAMEDGTCYQEDELCKLMKNPVVWPLVKHLVFVSNNKIGFYADGLLTTANGSCIPLVPKDELRIVHPIELYSSGEWQAFQKLLFDKAIRQPFKQVFRELYFPISEEENTKMSPRYTGIRVQTKKTVAALKGRRWISNYVDGLQKIYYKTNIIATIYAPARWFSPSEKEKTELEFICFHHRRDYKPLTISEVPPIIYSEVMRDADLAVSNAFADNLHPETSQPTIDMRRVLVELTMQKLNLNNVKVIGNSAHIDGKLGKYNIHLGNGKVYKSGNMQIAAAPIDLHSRKSLFLPFAEDDFQTTEILMKIIFFAEDDKIKDPSIIKLIK